MRQLLLRHIHLTVVHKIDHCLEVIVLDILKYNNRMLTWIRCKESLKVRAACGQNNFVRLKLTSFSRQGYIHQRPIVQQRGTYRNKIRLVVVPPQAKLLHGHLHYPLLLCLSLCTLVKLEWSSQICVVLLKFFFNTFPAPNSATQPTPSSVCILILSRLLIALNVHRFGHDKYTSTIYCFLFAFFFFLMTFLSLWWFTLSSHTRWRWRESFFFSNRVRNFLRPWIPFYDVIHLQITL